MASSIRLGGMRKRAIVLVSLLGVVLSGQVSAREQPAIRFDGRWWLKIDADEREGFLHGLNDCLEFGAGKKLSFPEVWVSYEPRVTSHYKNGNAAELVIDVFSKFSVPYRGKLKAGKNPYGDVFWRSHRSHTRTGFLEGFLTCNSSASQKYHWSNVVDYYHGQLDKMYNADDRFGDNAPEYEGSIDSAMRLNADEAGSKRP